MSRTRLLNKLRKFDFPEDKSAYKSQRNYCVKLFKRLRRDFYNNLNVKKVINNKYFWKTIKPNFIDKILRDEKIIFVEDDKVITAEADLAKISKDHFENILESLHIERLVKSTFSQHPSTFNREFNI